MYVGNLWIEEYLVWWYMIGFIANVFSGVVVMIVASRKFGIDNVNNSIRASNERKKRNILSIFFPFFKVIVAIQMIIIIYKCKDSDCFVETVNKNH